MKGIFKIVGLCLTVFFIFKSCQTKTQTEVKNNKKSIEDSISEKKRKLKEQLNKIDENGNTTYKDEAPPIDRLEQK